MTGQQCAVTTCGKIRRDGRPVCNRCLRRVGEPVLHRWFGYKRAVAAHPGSPLYPGRLEALEALMVRNATVYQQIRDTGQRPRWNTAGERWDNPRTAAEQIILRRYPHMAIGDGDPLRELVAELFPAEP